LGAVEHHVEFIAAVAGHAVDAAGDIAQRSCKLAESRIADRMTVPVVHGLEVVEVDEHDGVTGLNAGQDPLIGPSVGKEGQEIGAGHVFESAGPVGNRSSEHFAGQEPHRHGDRKREQTRPNIMTRADEP
jgi:hypothetical protein